jgi:hypothetical protein
MKNTGKYIQSYLGSRNVQSSNMQYYFSLFFSWILRPKHHVINFYKKTSHNGMVNNDFSKDGISTNYDALVIDMTRYPVNINKGYPISGDLDTRY